MSYRWSEPGRDITLLHVTCHDKSCHCHTLSPTYLQVTPSSGNTYTEVINNGAWKHHVLDYWQMVTDAKNQSSDDPCEGCDDPEDCCNRECYNQRKGGI